MATYKVIITDTIEAIVEAIDEDDAIAHAREMEPTINTTYQVEEVADDRPQK